MTKPIGFMRRGVLPFLSVVAALSITLFAQRTHAEYPAPLANPSTDVPSEWRTVVERFDFRKTPRYEETVALCRRLADASPWLEYQTFGTSPQGRAMPLVVASRDGTFTPKDARSSKHLTVFIQNCIHAGECAGKDASLMLLRDIAITKTRQRLLEHVNLIVIPIFSVDGHERFSQYSRINQNGPEEMGWRATWCNLGRLDDVHYFRSGDTLEFGSVKVHTIPTAHDAADGVAFVVEHETKKLRILTDLGHVFSGLRGVIESVDAAYLESNYDAQLLATSDYPARLKHRITGSGGHLSNDESAELVACCGQSRPKWVAVAHLSERNNRPELALASQRDAIGNDYPVYLAPRTCESELLEV